MNYMDKNAIYISSEALTKRVLNFLENWSTPTCNGT